MQKGNPEYVQQVIGAYPSERTAARAVRQLERHELSIQDIVIADRRRFTWRKMHPTPQQELAADDDFLVLMRGDPENIERAEALLHRRAQRGAASA